MPQIRVAPSGPRILGTADGDVLRWSALTAEWLPVPLASIVTPLSRELYVDSGAPPGGDGSIAAPFQTITEAFTAAAALPLGPVVVRATAGLYSEALEWPNRDALELLGSGPGETIIEAPAGAFDTISIIRGAIVSSARIEDVTVRNGNAGQVCFHVVGTDLAPLTSLSRGLTCRRLRLEPSGGAEPAILDRVGRVFAVDSDWTNALGLGETLVDQVSAFTSIRSTFGNVQLAWDQAAPQPGLGRLGHELQDSTLINGDLVLTDQPRLFTVDPTVRINGTVGGVLSAFLAFGPLIILNGTIQGAVSLTYPDLGGVLAAFSCDEAIFLDDVTIAIGAGATRLAARGRGSSFRQNLTAGDLVDFDARNSRIRTPLSAGSGTVDRTIHTILGADLSLVSSGVPITPPYPAAVAASYAAHVEQRLGTIAPHAVTGKTTTVVTVDFALGDVGRTGDLTLIRPDS
jgi:hypothetical protein